MKTIDRCPSTLAEGYNTYSPKAVRHFLAGKPVSHILPYPSAPNGSDSSIFDANRRRFSLSGAQSKYSAVIDGNTFRLTKEGEKGSYILKPALSDFQNRENSPANEHLTMQIASQVFGIETAENGLCFFEDGEVAYMVKRYDVRQDGTRIQQEDFASLAGLSAEKNGHNYKYESTSYEDIGNLIRRFLPAWPVEVVKYFDVLLFNFLFANGDAHIKNFSVLKTDDGDYRLAPAYDLINTLIHLPGDTIFALRKGLYNGWTDRYVTGKDFLELATRIGINSKVAERELERFCADYSLIDSLIDRSFLAEDIKEQYRGIYKVRLKSFLRA